jgi:hypothetical protein
VIQEPSFSADGLEALRAPFRETGAIWVQPPVLQPLSMVLDLAGEALRSRLFVLQAAAGESLTRTFLEVARHRLPGATFDSLLQEALAACESSGSEQPPTLVPPMPRGSLEEAESLPQVLPVVLTPDLYIPIRPCPPAAAKPRAHQAHKPGPQRP